MGEEQSGTNKLRTRVGMGAYRFLGLVQVVLVAESRSMVMEHAWGHHGLGSLQHPPGRSEVPAGTTCRLLSYPCPARK